jgi:hypothetical protein
MKKAGKEYKKKIDANINIHRKEMSRKIKNLRSNNSKEYWNILRQGTNKKQPNISIDSLFEFFRNINKAPETNNSAFFISSLVSIDRSILQRLFNFLYCLRAILQSVLSQGLEEIHTFSFFFSYNRVSCTKSFFCSGQKNIS